tara:strand:- start:180 stop:632 length:453 start_codon:yes stop_codon:yes gene_type:complete
MSSSIQQHEEAVRDALKFIITLETQEREIEKELKNQQLIIGNKLAAKRRELEIAWQQVQELMNETGEAEVKVESALQDYVIYRTKSKGKTVVADVEAVPENFLRIKKEPDLMAIKSFYEQYKPENLPNWLKFEKGEGKLTWKSVKKESVA